MTLSEAKSELYAKLRNFDDVVGASTRVDCIVIYLAKKSKKIIKEIPSSYEGHKVIYEITGVIRAL